MCVRRQLREHVTMEVGRPMKPLVIAGVVALLGISAAVAVFAFNPERIIAPLADVAPEAEVVPPLVGAAEAAVATDALDRSLEVPVSTAVEVPSEQGESTPWSPDRIAQAEKDPQWGVPLETKPFLHFLLNNYDRSHRDSSYGLQSGKLLRNPAANPSKKSLTKEQTDELMVLLRPHNEGIALIEAQYWRALGTAYHRQAERGDYVVLQRPDASVKLQDQTQVVIKATADLEARYGRVGEDLFCMTSSLPKAETFALFFAARAVDPEVFVLWDELTRIRTDAEGVARLFIAGV